MTFSELLATPSDLVDASTSTKCAVVLMTRIRLARNLAGQSFPGWAGASARADVYARCLESISDTSPMRNGFASRIEDLGELQRQVLVERHLISRELSSAREGSGVAVSRDQSVAVMINEEDHLRIQVLRAGFQLKRAWSAIDQFDTALESHLDYAFSPELGYLTACPTNLGTGMRASAMMHLPALVISSQMEKVIRAVNQLGMVVRGLFGEGSDASGSIFQISNQTTLGESEEQILKRLNTVLTSIIDHELNARQKLVESDASKLADKIGRAFGILSHCHLLNSGEAMNLLSLLRLGVDLGMLPEKQRAVIDRLFIETQPGHVQHLAHGELESGVRDHARASRLREEIAAFPPPSSKPNFNQQN